MGELPYQRGPILATLEKNSELLGQRGPAWAKLLLVRQYPNKLRTRISEKGCISIGQYEGNCLRAAFIRAHKNLFLMLFVVQMGMSSIQRVRAGGLTQLHSVMNVQCTCIHSENNKYVLPKCKVLSV